MSEPKTLTLEVTSLYRLLNDLETAIVELEGLGTFTLHVEDGRDVDNNKDRRARRAAVARNVLRAAEVAGLLRAELHMRYWQMKGYDHPQEERDAEWAS